MFLFIEAKVVVVFQEVTKSAIFFLKKVCWLVDRGVVAGAVVR